MSKPVNPILIGSFTVGALVLLITGIFVFGSGQLFGRDESRYVIFFDSSLNGLEIGAPVKMQGVKIGEVIDISLQIDPDSSKIYKPVVIEIDRNSFSDPSGSTLPLGLSRRELEANRDKLVEAGFRARLETQSLLTGLLYIDLDLHPDKKALYIGHSYHGYLEIPAIPKTSDEIFNAAEEIVKKIQALPLDQIVMDFSDSLKEIKELLASEETRKSRAALANTLTEMERFLGTMNANLEPILKDAESTMTNTTALVRDLRREIKPVLVSTREALTAATSALNETKDSMSQVGDAVGPESTLNATLQSLRDATRSLVDLTDYLERHPESLISGKTP